MTQNAKKERQIIRINIDVSIPKYEIYKHSKQEKQLVSKYVLCLWYFWTYTKSSGSQAKYDPYDGKLCDEGLRDETPVFLVEGKYICLEVHDEILGT